MESKEQKVDEKEVNLKGKTFLHQLGVLFDTPACAVLILKLLSTISTSFLKVFF